MRSSFKLLPFFLSIMLSSFPIAALAENTWTSQPAILEQMERDSVSITDQESAYRVCEETANIMFETQHWEKAIPVYLKALTMKPDNPSVLSSLAQCYMRINNYPEAIKYALKASNLDPTNPILYHDLGKLYLESRDFVKAEEALKKTLDIYPDYGPALYWLRYVYSKTEQEDKTLKILQNSVGDFLKQVAPGEDFKKIVEDRNKELIEEYEASIDKSTIPEDKDYFKNYYFLEQWDAGIKLCRQIINKNPAHKEAWFNLGKFYSKKGQNDEALKAYDALLKIQPDNIEALKEIGLVYQEMKLYEKAIDSFQKCQKIKPDSKTSFQIGSIHDYMRKFQLSLATYKEILEREPENQKAQVNLGNAYIELDRAEEAVHIFKKMLAKDPGDSEAHAGLGRSLAKLGRHGEAVKEFEQAIGKNARTASAWRGLCSSKIETKEYQEAMMACNKLLALDPDNYLAHYGLGLINNEIKQFDKAMEHFQLSNKLNPYGYGYLGMGMANARRGDYLEALDIFRMIIHDDPKNRYARSHMAITYLRTGYTYQGIEILTELMEEDPGSFKEWNQLGQAYLRVKEYKKSIYAYMLMKKV